MTLEVAMGRRSVGAVPALDLGSMSAAFPLADVERILAETNRVSQRKRKLPAHVMTYYVIALGLLASVGAREVLRRLLDRYRSERGWPGELASEAAISKARQRLGAEPLRRLFDDYVRPIATRAIKSAWYRTWRIVTLDATTLQMLDTPQNDKRFGRPPASRGSSAWPQLRLAALLENGTRVLFAAAFDAYHTAESALARRLLNRLEPGMLCLADRGFYGFELWSAAAASGADLLWRVQKTLTLAPIERLADGSYLSHIYRNAGHHRQGKPRLVRVICFTVTLNGKSEPYRLITTILDPQKAPALELARLYASRWTIETAFREFKVHLRDRRLLLRSKLPELVEQDVYGLLLAHFGVRRLMCESARQEDIEPAELSFSHALHLIVQRLPELVAFSPSAEDALP
jgi:transposase IS4-like protein/DDE family transposase